MNSKSKVDQSERPSRKVEIIVIFLTHTRYKGETIKTLNKFCFNELSNEGSQILEKPSLSQIMNQNL